MSHAAELFREQIAAYGTKDIDRLMQSFAPNAVLQDMAEPDSPYVGHDGIRGFLEEYFSHLSDVETAITALAVTDDTALGELEVKAKYAADPAQPENARPVLFRYCLVDTIEDGKIARERFYWDSAEFEAQL